MLVIDINVHRHTKYVTLYKVGDVVQSMGRPTKYVTTVTSYKLRDVIQSV